MTWLFGICPLSMLERLHYTPHPHQRVGTQFILDHYSCNLWAKPGMGKTGIVLSLLDLLQLGGSDFFPALVIAPKRVADIVWPTELAKWDAFAGMTMTNIPGTHRERAEALRKPKTDIYVTQYENVQWLVEQFEGKTWPFKIVVADESRRLSGFRLNKGGKRSTALSNIAKFTGRWINLTGTPAPNGLTDLWGQSWFLDFGASLGRTYTQFVDNYFKVDPYTHAETLLPGAGEQIHAKIAPFTLALRPEDWFTLELPRYSTVEVELPPAAKPVYKRMERDYFTEVGANIGIEAVNGGVKSMKLLQLASGSIFDASHTAHAVHDAKLEGLESVVSELQEPLLVAYYFTFTPDRIQKLYKNARVLRTARDVDDWNAGKIDMMLVHYQSAGHGLNLQDGGRALVYFDEIWDAELREQVLERLGPMRQKQSGHARTVLVYDIITKDTMDVEARERIDSKLSVQDALMLARARRA